MTKGNPLRVGGDPDSETPRNSQGINEREKRMISLIRRAMFAATKVKTDMDKIHMQEVRSDERCGFSGCEGKDLKIEHTLGASPVN